jgi:DNA polymerase-3 subunit delta
LRVAALQLGAALEAGLRPAYLVSGDEPLLIDEAADAIRAAARAAGFTERSVFFIERSFAWEDLRHAAQSLSLFAERRILELRMPTGKPDKGAALLADLAENPPPDVLSLVVTGKLDRKSADAAWVQAFAARGAWITVRPVGPAELPAWLVARARGRGAVLDAAAAQLIADRVEGNLLAASQEIDTLVLLADGARIDADLVLRAVGHSARYDVFQVAEAAAAGQAGRALQVLRGLKSEGVEPPLILWALVREIRGLWQAAERNRLQSTQRSAWNQAAVPSAAALARLPRLSLGALLAEASLTDRIVKGLAAGDAWLALTGLTAMLAGALQPNPVSARVS